MALIVLTSASGAPGVSTSTLGMAMTWPRRVVVVDADPVGGSTYLAGWFHGAPPHHRGLATLALAADRELLAESLSQVFIPLVPEHADLVAGSRSPAQAASIHRIWPELGETLTALDSSATDALVDAGRLGQRYFPEALIELADLVVLVSTATLPAISAARGRLRELREQMRLLGTDDRLCAMLVGPGRTFSIREVQDVLGVPIVAALPWDPRSAQALYLGEQSSRLRRSALSRALATAAASLRNAAAVHRTQVSSPLNAAGTVSEANV